MNSNSSDFERILLNAVTVNKEGGHGVPVDQFVRCP
jgi:hypothetical protein